MVKVELALHERAQEQDSIEPVEGTTGQQVGGYGRTSNDFWVAPGRHFRLRHLEIFWAVMRAGTQHEASKLLGMSQPAVSKLLRHVEDQVGTALFRRERGRLVPTAEGNLFFAAVDDVFAKLEAAERLVRDMKRRFAGRASVAVMPGLASAFLPHAAKTFLAEQPDVTLALKVLPSAQIIERLMKNEIEIGIVYGPVEATFANMTELCATSIVCVVPARHELASRLELRPADLAGQRIITVTYRPLWAQPVARAFEHAGVDMNIVVDCSGPDVAYQMASEGVGIAIVPMLPERQRQFGDVVVIPFAPAIEVPVLALMNKGGSVGPLGEAFADWLKHSCRSFRWVPEPHGTRGPPGTRNA